MKYLLAFIGLTFSTIELTSSQILNVTFSNANQYTISYNLNDSSCRQLQSTNVDPAVKCLILCQTTLCKSVKYEKSLSLCNMTGSRLNLIEYNSLPDLYINYNIANTSFGQPCTYDVLCMTGSYNQIPKCSNGLCNCIRDLNKFNYGMINEWTFNNTLLDSVQCNDLTQYTGAQFVQESTSPLVYSGSLPGVGYYSAPPDIYFTGNFTITVQLYFMNITSWSRMLDFGNGAPVDNVQFALSYFLTGQPCVIFYNNAANYAELSSTIALPFSQWTHIAVVVNKTTLSIYMNGSLVGQLVQNPLNPVPNVIRYNNYIGKSNWWWDGAACAKFRNLRIFNRAIGLSEISQDMIT